MEKARENIVWNWKVLIRTEVKSALLSYLRKKSEHYFRDTDRVTDVLSFPQFEDLNDVPDFGEICLGDVVICADRVREQAQELGHSIERETIYLFTHSILHLLGYDHMGGV